MTSSRPYLIRAFYEWITDNGMTPHVLVDTSADGVRVPGGFAKDDKINLNIGASAVSGLALGNDEISFRARFNGKSMEVYFPNTAVIGIFARENGQGMMFTAEESTQTDSGDEGPQTDPDPEPTPPPRGSHLKVVK